MLPLPFPSGSPPVGAARRGGRQGADIWWGKNTPRIWAVASVVRAGESEEPCGTVAVVLEGGGGVDVSAVVRARARTLAEVELERLNLSLALGSPEPGALWGPHHHWEPRPSVHFPGH